MRSAGIAQGIPLEALIDILIKLEKKRVTHIDVELFLKEDVDKGDRLIICGMSKGKKKVKTKTKKSKNKGKVSPLTESHLEELLKHV